MWLQNYVLPLGFLLSSVSRAETQQPITYNPSRIDADCSGKVYTQNDLDTAAREACSQYSKQNFCGDNVSYHIKKCIPGIPKVSVYDGPFYKEHSTHGPLLRWPLSTKWFESARYHAIVYWEPQKRQCKAIGAIQRADNKIDDQCDLRKYDETTNKDSIRSSSLQREDDLGNSQMTSMERGYERFMKRIADRKQLSVAQPELDTNMPPNHAAKENQEETMDNMKIKFNTGEGWARQPLYRHRKEFNTGVRWVRRPPHRQPKEFTTKLRDEKDLRSYWD